jgi:hypothetical protein
VPPVYLRHFLHIIPSILENKALGKSALNTNKHITSQPQKKAKKHRPGGQAVKTVLSFLPK